MNQKKCAVAKVVCVTGATGLIGRYLVQRLIECGHHVRGLSRKSLGGNPIGSEYFKGDLRDEGSLKPFLDGAFCVINSAGNLKDDRTMFDVNVRGTVNLARMCERAGVSRFVQMSSAGVVGLAGEKTIDESKPCRPRNNYERSKREAELALEAGIRVAR